MSAPAHVPRMSMLFVIVTFGVAIAVAILIAYFGITGQIGAGIP